MLTWRSHTQATCGVASRRVSLTAPHRLANFKPLKLRVIQIQRLVVPCPTMRRTERFGLCPCFKDGSVLPHRVGRIKCVVLSLGAFEKVKFYKAWHLVEVTIA